MISQVSFSPCYGDLFSQSQEFSMEIIPGKSLFSDNRLLAKSIIKILPVFAEFVIKEKFFFSRNEKQPITSRP